MNAIKKFAIAVLVACAFSSCSSNGPAWNNYAPELRTRIDALAAAKNCAGLQTQFNNADSNDSVDLMKYIDKALKNAGCY